MKNQKVRKEKEYMEERMYSCLVIRSNQTPFSLIAELGHALAAGAKTKFPC